MFGGVYDVGVDFVVLDDDCDWFVFDVECYDVVFGWLFVGEYDVELCKYFECLWC